jgi:hypothetical protein
MKRHILTAALVVLVLLAIVSCKGAQEDAEPIPPAAQTASTPRAATMRPGGGSFLAIHEVGLGPEGWVSLTNFTGVTVSTAGLHLCQGSACFALPEAEIPAGEIARVAVGSGAGIEDVIAKRATIGELRSPDGEIALYATRDLDEPGAMLVYLQWGSTPHELTETAIAAGLWVEGGYAPTTEDATRLFRVPESGLWLFEE